MNATGTNRIKDLLKINIPIIQAGMVWCSGWKLASAVSNAGGLGLIGAGSMDPETLRKHVQRCKAATSRSFGVNVPLLYPEIQKVMNILIAEEVPIVFTSAGSPDTWTGYLKERGIIVVHVVSSVRFGKKSEQAGVDAVVAEGFEAGGHNGREETTTLCLVPMVKDAVSIPVIAAGGIGSGRAIAAMEALGADGVQVGTRFAISMESSAHQNFKERVISSQEGETVLTLKKLQPVRMLKNEFFQSISAAESRGATTDELKELLGKGRSKKGIFEGELEEGELEIGQVSASLHDILPAADVLMNLWDEYLEVKKKMCLS